MTRIERVQDYRSLWVLLIAVGLLAGVAMTSCGQGGDGGSDGLLCDQCGDDPDGPCVPSITVFPDPGNDNIPQCSDADTDPADGCTVRLQCRRKVDSGQQRCFPIAPGGDVDYQFRCDGSRPGGTPRPQPTATETPEPQPTSTAAQVCGNGVREGTEVCDGVDLNGQTCATRGCNPPTGALSCRVTCQAFNTELCNGTGCREN